jgi:hypothetical protein
MPVAPSASQIGIELRGSRPRAVSDAGGGGGCPWREPGIESDAAVRPRVELHTRGCDVVTRGAGVTARITCRPVGALASRAEQQTTPKWGSWHRALICRPNFSASPFCLRVSAQSILPGCLASRFLSHRWGDCLNPFPSSIDPLVEGDLRDGSGLDGSRSRCRGVLS